MTNRNIAIVLILALFTGTLVYMNSVNLNLPGISQGYAPDQPVAFSHRLHSGDLQMACSYCHNGAERSRYAVIPDAGTCMNCHRFVTSRWDNVKIEEQKALEENRPVKMIVSAELQKLYKAVGFSTDEMKYTESAGEPIEWIRVYKVPDFVYFDHRRHVNGGVACQTCHGPVETMEKVSQFPDLTMGWCVNCHRDVNNGLVPELKGRYASTSCTVCHY